MQVCEDYGSSCRRSEYYAELCQVKIASIESENLIAATLQNAVQRSLCTVQIPWINLTK